MNKSREEIFSSGRIRVKFEHLKRFKLALLGGSKIKNSGVGYAHDLLLDTYDEAGVFAFLALICFMISSVRTLLKCLKDMQMQLSYRTAVLSLYVAFFVEFFVEPIIQGLPWLFMLFCCVCGIVTQVTFNNEKYLTLQMLKGEKTISNS